MGGTTLSLSRPVSRLPLNGWALAVALLVVAMLVHPWFTPSAEGRTGAAITVGESQTVEKEYPGIPGNNPGATPRDPNTCSTVVYCDTIDLTVQVPGHYSSQTRYTINITVAWQNSDLNNLNIYAFDRDKTTQLQGTTGPEQPEEIALYDPPGGKYFVVVLNATGVNNAYKAKVEFVAETQGTSAGSSSVSSGTARLTPSPPPRQILAFTSATPAAPAPNVPARPVAVAGPDGGSKTSTLESLGEPTEARGRQIASFLLIAWAAIVVGGLLVWWLRWRRRRSWITRETTVAA